MLSAATESEPSPLSFGLSNLGPISILPSWVLDLVAPCNPVMEPHLKARRIPQRTISLKQSHYQCLSMCGGHSKATGRSSASTRGHRGEVLPSTLTSRAAFPACWTTISWLPSVTFVWLLLASVSAVITADFIMWFVIGFSGTYHFRNKCWQMLASHTYLDLFFFLLNLWIQDYLSVFFCL